MYIENGNTLVVKSGFEFYEKERSGKKPNTWRYFDSFDSIDMGPTDVITKIRVMNELKPECSFVRVVNEISFYGSVMIISWEHSNGTN